MLYTFDSFDGTILSRRANVLKRFFLRLCSSSASQRALHARAACRFPTPAVMSTRARGRGRFTFEMRFASFPRRLRVTALRTAARAGTITVQITFFEPATTMDVHCRRLLTMCGKTRACSPLKTCRRYHTSGCARCRVITCYRRLQIDDGSAVTRLHFTHARAREGFEIRTVVVAVTARRRIRHNINNNNV